MEESTQKTIEVEQPLGITCISDDCAYHNPVGIGKCGFQYVVLRKGTCRYYNPKAKLDRTDLGDGDYCRFVRRS